MSGSVVDNKTLMKLVKELEKKMAQMEADNKKKESNSSAASASSFKTWAKSFKKNDGLVRNAFQATLSKESSEWFAQFNKVMNHAENLSPDELTFLQETLKALNSSRGRLVLGSEKKKKETIKPLVLKKAVVSFLMVGQSINDSSLIDVKLLIINLNPRRLQQWVMASSPRRMAAAKKRPQLRPQHFCTLICTETDSIRSRATRTQKVEFTSKTKSQTQDSSSHVGSYYLSHYLLLSAIFVQLYY